MIKMNFKHFNAIICNNMKRIKYLDKDIQM